MPIRRSNNSSEATAGWIEQFLACRSVLFSAVSRFVKPHEIEDIVQETFVRSYAAARTKTIHNPRAFMLKTARNLALNSLSRADYKRTVSPDDLLECESLSFDLTPEACCESQEEFLIFCRAVAELPLQCRRAFILKKVYGLSQREIAERLEVTQSTVEKHIAKGMVMTAQYMLENGYAIRGAGTQPTQRSRDEAQGS